MFLEAAYIVPHPPIILPEVGRGEEMKIQKTTNAYIEVAKRISQIEPDTIIITSPHYYVFLTTSTYLLAHRRKEICAISELTNVH